MRPPVIPNCPPSARVVRGAGHTVLIAGALLGATLLGGVRAAAAQLPELPVLQSGFTRPGLAAAVNYGTGDETSTVALAGAWTPASGRFQLSGGVGLLEPPGDASSRPTAGVRVALPVPTPWTREPTSAFGLTAFGGVGGAWRDEENLLQFPVGVGLGYRRAIGASRALALYATPFYTFIRRTADDETDGGEAVDEDAKRSNLFRTAVGVDFTLTAKMGVTAGYEFGSNAETGRPGPTGGIFGIGLSYAF